MNDRSLELEELTILCRESTLINDRMLTACTPHLEHTGLRSLSLAGCAKLTGAPLVGLLPSLPFLRHLSLEATAIHPSSFPSFAPHLTSLLSLKLTHPGPHHPALLTFFPSLAELLRETKQLEAFTLYHSGAAGTGTREWPVVDSSFVHELVESVGAGLRKIEMSNVLIRVADVEALAWGAPNLRDLVIHLGADLDAVSWVLPFFDASSLISWCHRSRWSGWDLLSLPFVISRPYTFSHKRMYRLTLYSN